MKNNNFKKQQLNRNELRAITGGKIAAIEQYKCCWAYSSDCSSCGPMGTCTSGAVLRAC
jgi:hypothetical protein